MQSTQSHQIVGRCPWPLALLCLVAACATTTEKPSAALDPEEIREVRRRQTDLETRISHLETRMDVLLTKVEQSIPKPPPDLELVRLAPPAEPAGSFEDDEEPIVLTLGPESNPVSVPKQGSGDVNEEYRQAQQLFKREAFGEARSRFEQILARHPKHELADNALYWSGVCDLERGEAPRAIATMQHLPVRFPGSPKIPDALYKIGEAYLLLGDSISARTYWNQILEQHPKSEVFLEAKKKLEMLGQGD